MSLQQISTNVQTPPALPVTAEHAERWQRALTRAQEARLEIAEAEYTTNQDGCEQLRLRISSASQPGHLHHTHADRDAGYVSTTCSCTAGSVPIPCTHAAMAVQTAGWWPFPIFTQTDMEHSSGHPVGTDSAAVDTAPAAAFAKGAAVRLVWQPKLTYWIHDIIWDGCGWVYALEDERRRVVVAAAPERALVKATSKRAVMV